MSHKNVVDRQVTLLLACIAANCIANIPLWLLPEILSDSMEYLKLTTVQSSWVVSAETIALAFSSIFLASRDFKVSYRQVAVVGAIIGLAGNFLSAQCDTFEALNLSRGLAGLGEGAVLMVANTLVADFEKPDRAYAVINLANIVYGSLAFFTLPIIFPQRSGLMVFNIAAVAMAALAPVLYWTSTRLVQRTSHLIEAETVRPDHHVFSVSAMTLYSAMLFLGSGCGASWSLMVEFGKAVALTQEQIDWAIGIGILAAIAGSGFVAVIELRFGRLTPVLLVTLGTAAVNYSISHTEVAAIFRADILGVLFGMYFLLPYFLGFGADIDKSGRVSAIVCAIFMLTSGSLGPIAGGFITDKIGIYSVGTATAASCAIAAILTIVFVRMEHSARIK